MKPLRANISISVRLAIGFMLLLAIFGIALLGTLHNMRKLNGAIEEITMRERIRRMGYEVGAVMEQLRLSESDFIYADEMDWSKHDQFLALCDNIAERLRTLRGRPLGPIESGFLEQLEQTLQQLRSLFLEQVVQAKVQASRGSADRLLRLQQQSVQLLDRMRELNDSLISAMEGKAELALDQATTAWQVSLTITSVLFPICLMISLMVVYYTHRSIIGPVASLTEGTRRLASGELDSTIQVAGSSEFRQLAEHFNRMARALRAHQQQLVQAEKLAGVGRLAAGVAHEINNPLTVILGHAKMLMAAAPPDAPEREQLQAIADEARNCKGIVDALMDMSRPSQPTEGEVTNPNEVVAEVLAMVQALQLSERVRVRISVIEKPLPLAISRSRLRQLLLNIVRNALEALRDSDEGFLSLEGYVRPGSKLPEELRAETDSDTRSFLVLVVSDNGPGVAPQDRARLFEPFFTTRADGMGLGLAISHSIVRSHGGTIGVQSELGVGTTFTIALPLQQQEQS